MLGRFFLFYTHFVIWTLSYWKNYFKISHSYISVKWAQDAQQRWPQGSPGTHNRPHRRRAVPTAAWPLFIHKNHFRNLQWNLNSWLVYQYPPLIGLKFKYFHEQNHTITDCKTFGKYFPISMLRLIPTWNLCGIHIVQSFYFVRISLHNTFFAHMVFKMEFVNVFSQARKVLGHFIPVCLCRVFWIGP